MNRTDWPRPHVTCGLQTLVNKLEFSSLYVFSGHSVQTPFTNPLPFEQTSTGSFTVRSISLILFRIAFNAVDGFVLISSSTRNWIFSFTFVTSVVFDVVFNSFILFSKSALSSDAVNSKS